MVGYDSTSGSTVDRQGEMLLLLPTFLAPNEVILVYL